MFDAHLAVWACNLALPKAGNSSEERIAMMAITTSNSINVKIAEQSRLVVAFGEFDGGSFMSFWCDYGTNRLCKLHTHESSDAKRKNSTRSGSELSVSMRKRLAPIIALVECFDERPRATFLPLVPRLRRIEHDRSQQQESIEFGRNLDSNLHEDPAPRKRQLNEPNAKCPI